MGQQLTTKGERLGAYKWGVVYGHTNTGMSPLFASKKQLQNKDASLCENPRLQIIYFIFFGFVTAKETTNPHHEFMSVPAMSERTCEIVATIIAYHAGVPCFRSAPPKTHIS